MKTKHSVLRRILLNSVLVILMLLIAVSAISKMRGDDGKTVYYGDSRPTDEKKESSDVVISNDVVQEAKDDSVVFKEVQSTVVVVQGETTKDLPKTEHIEQTESIAEDEMIVDENRLAAATEAVFESSETETEELSEESSEATESETAKADEEVREEDLIPVHLVCEGAIAMSYCVGAKSFNLTGISVYAVYQDGRQEMIDLAECTLMNFNAKEPGNYKGVLSYKGVQADIDYKVEEYIVEPILNGGCFEEAIGYMQYLDNYTLENLMIPTRSGYIFDGWYLDAGFTTEVGFPYKAAWGERNTKFYAKWIEETDFEIVNGIIRGYKGDPSFKLDLPWKDCYGIAKGALKNAGSDVIILEIGRNITSIEPGSFLGLTQMDSILVNSKNEYFRMVSTALYTKDRKTLIVFPAAYSGVYVIDKDKASETEHIADYAFYDSNLDTIVFNPTLKSVGNYAIGSNIKTVRFTGLTPPVFSVHAFGDMANANGLRIEVPMEATEEYQVALSKAKSRFAKSVVGYE